MILLIMFTLKKGTNPMEYKPLILLFDSTCVMWVRAKRATGRGRHDLSRQLKYIQAPTHAIQPNLGAGHDHTMHDFRPCFGTTFGTCFFVFLGFFTLRSSWFLVGLVTCVRFLQVLIWGPEYPFQFLPCS